MSCENSRPVFTLSLANQDQLANVSADDLASIWFAFHKCSALVEYGFRLENCSWRLWKRLAKEDTELRNSQQSINNNTQSYETYVGKDFFADGRSGVRRQISSYESSSKHKASKNPHEVRSKKLLTRDVSKTPKKRISKTVNLQMILISLMKTDLKSIVEKTKPLSTDDIGHSSERVKSISSVVLPQNITQKVKHGNKGFNPQKEAAHYKPLKASLPSRPGIESHVNPPHQNNRAPFKGRRLSRSMTQHYNSIHQFPSGRITKSQEEVAALFAQAEKKPDPPEFLKPSSVVVGFDVKRTPPSTPYSSEKQPKNDDRDRTHKKARKPNMFYLSDTQSDKTGSDHEESESQTELASSPHVLNQRAHKPDSAGTEISQLYGAEEDMKKRPTSSKQKINILSQEFKGLRMTPLARKKSSEKPNQTTDKDGDHLVSAAVESGRSNDYLKNDHSHRPDIEPPVLMEEADRNDDYEDENAWSSASNSPVDQLKFGKGRRTSVNLSRHQSMLSALLEQREAKEALEKMNRLKLEQEHNLALSGPKIPYVNFYHPRESHRDSLESLNLRNVDNDFNVSQQFNESPRTAKRNIIASELSESLRRNLMWERQQKGMNTYAALKRRNASSDGVRKGQSKDAMFDDTNEMTTQSSTEAWRKFESTMDKLEREEAKTNAKSPNNADNDCRVTQRRL